MLFYGTGTGFPFADRDNVSFIDKKMSPELQTTALRPLLSIMILRRSRLAAQTSAATTINQAAAPSRKLATNLLGRNSSGTTQLQWDFASYF
jgi:hypothetical protein